MKRFLDIVLFLGLLALVCLANHSFLGISSPQAEREEVRFDPALQVTEVLYSSELAPKVAGYGGAIPTVIGVDAEGIIKDIKFLKNGETAEFFQQILDSGITAKWVGKSMQNAASTKVDAVTGATMSSEGLIKTINTTLNARLGNKVDGDTLSHADIIKALSISFIGILGLISFFAPKRVKDYKTSIAFLTIAILGVWQGSMLSVAKMSSWLLGGVPNVVEIPLFLIFLAAILLPLFTGKNFYCYYMCPFGASQDLMARSIKLNIKVKIAKWLNHARIVILLMCFMLLIMGLGAHVADLEPFSAFKPEFAPLSAIIIFVTALVVSTFIPRAWCRFFCPCGAFLDLFKRAPKSGK